MFYSSDVFKYEEPLFWWSLLGIMTELFNVLISTGLQHTTLKNTQSWTIRSFQYWPLVFLEKGPFTWLNLIGKYVQNENYLTVLTKPVICLALRKSTISQTLNDFMKNFKNSTVLGKKLPNYWNNTSVECALEKNGVIVRRNFYFILF